MALSCWAIVSVAASGGDAMELHIVYVHDPLLPAISDNDLEMIIDEALVTYNTKFQAKSFSIVNEGRIDVQDFFNTYLDKESPQYRRSVSERIDIFGENNPNMYVKDVVRFFKANKWKPWDIQKFLKDYYTAEELAEMKTYPALAKATLPVYFEKVKKLTELRQPDGRPYLEQGKDYNSYMNWTLVMAAQDKYDVIICNTLIVYDVATQPWPHAALRFAKVGGSSFVSPRRPVFDGRTIMINLFEMLCSDEYFQSQYTAYNLTQMDWNRIIGSYIMAHEMGHMVYLIPDLYDIPRGCIMDSSEESMNYYTGWKNMQDNPDPCPQLQPWVAAREQVFKADALYRSGKYDDAVAVYKNAAKATPELLDENIYGAYMALLAYKQALCYKAKGDAAAASAKIKKAKYLLREYYTDVDDYYNEEFKTYVENLVNGL